MVKKIKRYIVFCLFSLFFSLLSGKIERSNGKINGNTWNAANAGKCCPSGTTFLGEGEACCTSHTETEGDPCY